MKINLKAFFPMIVVMLFTLSLTGYAHDRHDKHNEFDETKANTSLENLSSVSAEDLVSHWLEARIAQEGSLFSYDDKNDKARVSKSAFSPIWVFYQFEGEGQTCASCGCALYHGGPYYHGTYCSAHGMSCVLHAGQNCSIAVG